MAGKLTKQAFEKLIAEDIDWLKKQPRTLERDHIIEIVKDCVQFYYPDPEIEDYKPEELDYPRGFSSPGKKT